MAHGKARTMRKNENERRLHFRRRAVGPHLEIAQGAERRMGASARVVSDFVAILRENLRSAEGRSGNRKSNGAERQDTTWLLPHPDSGSRQRNPYNSVPNGHNKTGSTAVASDRRGDLARSRGRGNAGLVVIVQSRLLMDAAKALMGAGLQA